MDINLPNRISRVLALTLIALSNIQVSLACECLGTTTKDRLSHSEAVFVGKVIHVEDYYEKGFRDERIKLKRARIKVLKAWKGIAVGRVLEMRGGGDMCGVDFNKEGQYLIFANYYADSQKEKHLGTSRCETGPVEQMKNVLDELQNGDKTSP